MSPQNKAGNSSANHCRKHGDFIGMNCPVCAGVTHSVREPGYSKGHVRHHHRSGMYDEDDE